METNSWKWPIFMIFYTTGIAWIMAFLVKELHKMKYTKKDLKIALGKTGKSIFMTIPILFGVLLLIGLFQTIVSNEMLVSLFRGNAFVDALTGAVIGAVSAGNPVTSYVLGGEMLELGIGIIAVTAFIVAWVSVGTIQLPAEILMLGKRFALLRNALSFVSAIIIGLLTYLILLIC